MHTYSSNPSQTSLAVDNLSCPATVMLWDSLLADPHRFAFLLHFCVGMVRAEREALLSADFGRCVKLLQNYPCQDFLRLLGTAIQLRAEDNADVAHRGGAPVGEGTGLWAAPLSALSPPPKRAGQFAPAPAPVPASVTAAAAHASSAGAAAAAVGNAAAEVANNFFGRLRSIASSLGESPASR